MKNEELKSRMDRVIEWVKTCDTKASIMLTLVCLMASFVFTSDYVLNGMTAIIKSFREYDCTNYQFSDVCISGIATIIFLLVALYYIAGSIYRFIMVLYSKIDETLDDNSLKKIIYILANKIFLYKPHQYNFSGADTTSLIHFNNISNMAYANFKSAVTQNAENADEAENSDDLISQIYMSPLENVAFI